MSKLIGSVKFFAAFLIIMSFIISLYLINDLYPKTEWWILVLLYFAYALFIGCLCYYLILTGFWNVKNIYYKINFIVITGLVFHFITFLTLFFYNFETIYDIFTWLTIIPFCFLGLTMGVYDVKLFYTSKKNSIITQEKMNQHFKIEEPFVIQSKISEKEYVNTILRLTYRKPLILYITIVGILMLIYSLLERFHLMSTNNSGPFTSEMRIVFGFIILLSPVLTKFQLTKIYKKSPRLHEEIEICFSDERIIMKANTFSATYNWISIVKIEKIGNFLLLYTGKMVAEFVNTDGLRKHQIELIQNKIIFRS